MDKLNILLIELGNTLDIDRVTAYDNQMWAIYTSSGEEIEVQSIDEREELLFSIKAFEGEEAFELKKLKTLLEYNFLYQESGGVQFCVNPESQEVHMQVSMPMTSEVSGVSTMIAKPVELGKPWNP